MDLPLFTDTPLGSGDSDLSLFLFLRLTKYKQNGILYILKGTSDEILTFLAFHDCQLRKAEKKTCSQFVMGCLSL